MNPCWCGSTRSAPFGPNYHRCLDCQTLVYSGSFSLEDCLVKDDDRDFYGKSYWLERQEDALGYPNFESRTRADLSERNLFWLEALSRFKAPPARTLELGCAHGSFVSLLKLAGYQAEGLEMSPWVVNYGQSTFGVSIHQGPLENTQIPEGTLDAIVMMDVIEHLPDPRGTLAHCLRLLKPDGVLLIQTPEFQESMTFDALNTENGAFLEQLKPGEHLFMFSRTSIVPFFESLGAPHIEFLPAIFSKYDMFLAVGKSAFQPLEKNDFESAMAQSPTGRLVQALLDLYDREEAHLRKIDDLGLQLEELGLRLVESDADRTARLTAIQQLTQSLKESEKDRGDRFEQIQELTTIAQARGKTLEAFRHWTSILLGRPMLKKLGFTVGLPEIKALSKLLEQPDD